MTTTHLCRAACAATLLFAVGACTDTDKSGNAPSTTSVPNTAIRENLGGPVRIVTVQKGTGAATAPDKGVTLEAASDGKTWALVIGAKQYQTVPPLRYTAADAEALAEALTKVGGIPSSQILRITDDAELKPDHATLSKQVAAWLSRPEIAPNDSMIVYFSGHGVLDSEEAMYLAPTDIKVKEIKQTALPAATLREQLRTCKAGAKLLLLDACHSGSSKGVTIEGTNPVDGARLASAFKYAPGVVTISGCKAEQFSWESNELKHGVFTHFLTEGLTGRADADGNRKIDIDELYRYVSDRVPKKTQEEHKTSQDPVRWIGPDVVGVPVVMKLPGNAPVPPKPPDAAPAPPPPSANQGNVVTLLDEDFSKAKRGELPAGWVGADSVKVGREGDKACLMTSTDGMHRVYTPPLAIRGDFQVECVFQIPSGAALGLTLESEGTRDLRAGASDWASGITATLAAAEPRAAGATGGKVLRLVVQREGDVCKSEIEGEEVIVHRIKGLADFERLAIDLNNTATRLYRVTVRAARPHDAAPLPKPTPVAQRYAFYEDFAKTKPGEDPKGWTCPAAVGAHHDGGLGWLQTTKEGEFEAKSPEMKLTGDFQLESHVWIPSGATLGILLDTGDKETSLPVKFGSWANSVSVTLADAEPREAQCFGPHISRVVLRREGKVCTVAVDGVELVRHRLEKAEAYKGVTLSFGATGKKVYDLGIRSLERGK